MIRERLCTKWSSFCKSGKCLQHFLLLSIYLYISLKHSFSVALCFKIFLILSISRMTSFIVLSLSLSVSLYHSFTFHLSLSSFINVYLSISHSLSVVLSVCNYLAVFLILSVTLCQFNFISFTVFYFFFISHPISFSLSLWFVFSISDPLSLSSFSHSHCNSFFLSHHCRRWKMSRIAFVLFIETEMLPKSDLHPESSEANFLWNNFVFSWTKRHVQNIKFYII